ncbi:phosphomannomutase/phosphoglucomutase [Sansalvadorimonas sp. 2012CJ34-2]|uniref:phosphomannomutase n=1 Tax=Parendozoicomonas callyspongiae TaxID=2942213 RepID=A0ABT0PEC6_9GAMM|nr:phosphomannomutase/phosphoglucomutase [Sansalvadorimonas sp. 2012CJ34-2]
MQAEEAEKIPASIFRANDIRGVVEKTLTDSAVTLIGQAIASEAHARNEKTIVVANDSRLSSPMLKASLIKGLVASGCNVISIGTVPTPVLYFATHVLDAHSGVMITGSHSAPDYNGLKIVIGGHRLVGDEITDLYRRIVESDFMSGHGSVSTEEMISRYQKHVLNDVVLPRPLKVVVDCGNGVAAKIAPRLFEQLGCEVIPLYCTADGTFPHYNPDQSQTASKGLEKLIKDVKEHKADMGFSIDGDGDRVGFVTNAGNVIYPDELLMLLSRDVLSRNPGANIIFDVKSTRRLSSLINNCGGRPVLWKSGHSFIKQKMVETNALLAGEMSGHIFFKERWFGFDDGIYSAARIAEVLANEADAAEMVFKTLPSAESTSELFIPASEANKFGLIERLKKEGEFGDASITTIDGIRADYPWGWGLARASNTTSALTLRFEADDNEGLERIKTLFKKQLLALDPELKIPF